MPNRKITFLIVPEDNSNVKQVKFSRVFLGLMACVILLGLTGISFIIHDYLALKSTIPSVRSLKREVTSQRSQIHAYANKIRALNSEMKALHDFEKKLRVIANVEAPAGQDAVFGIGGTMGADLENLPPLTENHSSVIRAMHAQLEQLDEASVVQKQAFEELHDYLQDQKSLLASTPAIRPTTGWFSSGFGYRISPFTGLKEFHRGLDIATRRGTPIVAPADGVVTFAGKKGGLGNMLVIDHGHGKVTRYGHMQKWLARRGTHVKRGDKIGLVGNTGRSTAPHLHYEVHVNGIPVNPGKYILN
ncbi:MAG: M23 family metallopeptidase [Proteobacteria bacterium]|nr:M23 family metallopeptidase [Pseudomonadota bacterium]